MHKEGHVTWLGRRQQRGGTLDLLSFGGGEARKRGGEVVDATSGEEEGRVARRGHGGKWSARCTLGELGESMARNWGPTRLGDPRGFRRVRAAIAYWTAIAGAFHTPASQPCGRRSARISKVNPTGHSRGHPAPRASPPSSPSGWRPLGRKGGGMAMCRQRRIPKEEQMSLHQK